MQINTRENVIGAGTIATHLHGNKFETARENALDVLATTGTVDWEYGKVRAWGSDPFGSHNEKHPGMNVARPRFDTTYRAHCDLFALPHGTIYLPCYICGNLFDAWTMDVEHVFGRLHVNGGTRPGGLLLADSGCNTAKGDTRMVPHQTRTMLESSPAAHALWARMGRDGVVNRNWHRRERRAAGLNSSTPWQD